MEISYLYKRSQLLCFTCFVRLALGDISILKPFGGIYAEMITPENSGQKQSPIVFKPLTEDENVIITGTVPIPHEMWVRLSKNIFKAKIGLQLGH